MSVSRNGARSQQAVQIYVRMRPRLQDYEDEDAWKVDSYSVQSIQRDLNLQSNNFSEFNVIKRRYADAYFNYQFNFDNVFGPGDGTDVVYDSCCKQLINSVLQGYNATIFLYGQTTSGKTYTMLGDNECPGILRFTLYDIFRQQLQSTQLIISYLEIYNEQINDLLNPGAMNLKIHDDSKGYSVIQQLRQCPVQKYEEALQLLMLGEENRSYREKSLHEHSSRSHTIFQVRMERIQDGQRITSLLNMVDLAGSERLSEDEVIKNEVSSNEETGYINKSLFVLSNVINKLAEGKKSVHIPYRDSKLTRFLSNSLGGNSLTSIICTISPAAMNFYQTLSTLRFATRAKRVQNKVSLNEIRDGPKKSVEALEMIIQEKQQEIENLQKKLLESKGQKQGFQDEMTRIDQLSKYLTLHIRFEEEEKKTKQTQVSQESLKQQSLSQLFELESKKISKKYNDELQQLMEKYKRQLIELSRSYCTQVQEVDIEQLQNNITKQVSSESIFNEIYVNAILNPSSEIFQDQSIQISEMTQLLQEAFNEAIKSLQQRYQDYSSCLQDIYSARVFDLSLGLSSSEPDELNLQIQNIKQNCEWLSECRELLLEQYKKKIGVLEQAYVDVDSKISEKKILTRQSTERNINPIKNQHMNTPKFPAKRNSAGRTQLYVWGSGKDGRLGNSKETSEQFPVILPDYNVKFVQVSCGYYHSAAVSDKGQVYMWGKNSAGQLGLGHLQNQHLPTLCKSLYVVISQICCGWQHSLALDETGCVWAWGNGEDGQLGIGIMESTSEPQKVYLEQGVDKIACGHSHSAAITLQGKLFMWGCNFDGRLMVTSKRSESYPCESIFNKTNVKIRKVALGVNHTAVITADGKVFTAGDSKQGQLGVKLPIDERQIHHEVDIDNAIDVACGEEFTLVLTQQGFVYSFGKKSNGTLGHQMNLLPEQLILPKKIESLKKIKNIYAGKRHSVALNNEGELYCWGFNFYDQLGIGGHMRFVDEPVKINMTSPVQQAACGEFHSMALVQI